MQNPGKKYEIITLVLLTIWVTYYLSILLKTGFISDDAYNSQVKGWLLQNNISIHDYILSQIQGWVTGAGRFLVLSWYMTYGIYYITQNVFVIKALTIAIILIGILLFYVFSKRETNSSYIAFLSCFILPVFIQFRLWHDPVLAFTFLIPIIFALTMGALVSFQKYLDKGGQRYYLIAVGLFFMALLMYEISYILCLLFLAIAYMRSHNILIAIKQSLPFTLLTALLVGISTIIKLTIKHGSDAISTYPGAELHFELGKLISAFEIQTFSAIPLSYYFYNQENLTTKLYRLDYFVLTLFWLALAVFIYNIGKSVTLPKLSSWIVSGFILLFVPAALTALSGHQSELIQIGYGFGYLPVYLQYFGANILFVSLIYFISTKANKHWLIVFTIVVSATLTIVAGKNLKLNRAVALKSNETYLYPRELLKSALEAGIAHDLSSDSFLFRSMRYPSDYTLFYTMVTGKKFETCELSDGKGYSICITKLLSAGKVKDLSPVNANKEVEVLNLIKHSAWILTYNFEKKSGKSGRVILGKIDSVVQNNKSKAPIQIIVSQLKIYDLNQNKIFNFDFGDSPINFLKLIAQQAVDISEAKPFQQALFKVDDVDFEWLGNIHPLEGSESNNLRWSSGSATLVLHNLSGKSRSIKLSMGLATPTQPASQITIKNFGKTEILQLSSNQTIYSKTVLLPPGGRSQVEFESNAKPIQNGDPRNIVFGIFNFSMSPL